MKPIKIRGHHIRNFRNYLSCQASNCYAEVSEETYGKGFNRKIAKMFNKISEGKTPVSVVAGYDDICKICKVVRTEEGCIIGEVLHPEKKNYKDDIICTLTFKLEIGKIYEGPDFLKKIWVERLSSYYNSSYNRNP